MEYGTIAHWVKIGGTVFFFAFFMAVLLYVFWPGNREKFKKASERPISDESLISDNKNGESDE
ncbi:MAG: cbb3-type cytochrome c oxidase subunit 3 [Acidimicrobiales bacterium]|nr:cbb3-type cytochrome c oxidase subunit 3 [Hyphomonadaceae bacterium]RZV43950.1 MAG: cbb3-type cytochrome c oxidase subunit 3 [Acidimicrobiales bacterium]